jgi:hypothetical protein
MMTISVKYNVKLEIRGQTIEASRVENKIIKEIIYEAIEEAPKQIDDRIFTYEKWNDGGPY